MASQLEQWFKLADEDRDGSIGGAEAVRFFLKSGLGQDTLSQIWDLASGGAASLNQYQFQTAMRLVSLAQVSQGQLVPEHARVVAMGGGPQLPPPRLAGLSEGPPYMPQSTGMPYAPQQTGMSYAPQPTGQGYAPQMTGVSYAPQMTGAYAPQMTGQQGYAPQVTGAVSSYMPQASAGYAPQATGAYMPQPTGAGYVPQVTGPPGTGYAVQPTGTGYVAQPTGAGFAAQPAAASAAPAAAAPAGAAAAAGPFPPCTPADLNRYTTMFETLDKDKDGIVQGGDCFGAFMAWGLDKLVLKSIWDVVAGTAGSLKRDQFIKCVYLMDCAKRGIPVPSQLPPGPFPPTAAPIAALTAAGVSIAGVKPEPAPGAAPTEQWSLASQFGRQGMTKAVNESYSGAVKMPGLPGKVEFDGSKVVKPPAAPSAVPLLDETVSGLLGPSDKSRLEAATKEALQKEAAVHSAEAEAAAAKQRGELFQKALGELTVFRSRMDVALLQAQEHQARLVAEADDFERRYHNALASAQAQNESASAVREHLQTLLARKQEAANKLELITQELEMIQNMNPEEVRALEADVSMLVARLTQAEARKAAMELQLDGSKKQKELLHTRISDLDLAAAAAEASLGQARADVAAAAEKLQGVLDKLPDTEEIGQLLLRAAAAYRSLYSAAQAHGLDVPYEAQLNNVGGLVWVEEMLAGAADWMEDDEAGDKGYTVVNALPDLDGIPPGLLRPPATPPPAPMRRSLAAAPADGAPAPGTASPASNGNVTAVPMSSVSKAETPRAEQGVGVAPAAAGVAAGMAAAAAVGVAAGHSTSFEDDAFGESAFGESAFVESAFGEAAAFDAHSPATGAGRTSPFAEAAVAAPAFSLPAAAPHAPAAAPVPKAAPPATSLMSESSTDDAFTDAVSAAPAFYGTASGDGARGQSTFEDDAFSASVATGFADSAF